MNIPYTVEERPDTGLANGKLGIWLFLASEVMLFGALFSTYIILRTGAPEWPHGELNVWLGMINTFILIGSSVTMVMAWASLKLNDWGKHRLYLIATFLLAGVMGWPVMHSRSPMTRRGRSCGSWCVWDRRLACPDRRGRLSYKPSSPPIPIASPCAASRRP